MAKNLSQPLKITRRKPEAFEPIYFSTPMWVRVMFDDSDDIKILVNTLIRATLKERNLNGLLSPVWISDSQCEKNSLSHDV